MDAQMAQERNSLRVVSPYLMRPRRTIEEVLIQRRRPVAAVVNARDDRDDDGKDRTPNATRSR